MQRKKIPAAKHSSGSEKKQGKERLRKLTMAAILLFAVLLVYSGTYSHSFQFDDHPNITENPAIRDIYDADAWWNFVPSRPLGTLSFALNYHFSGTEVGAYHTVNTLIHCLNTLLIFVLGLLLFRTPSLRNSAIINNASAVAFTAALIFACHPLFTQAVTYIVQRLASMATMFYLLSLYSYVAARLHQEKRKRLLFFIIAGMAAVAGFLTKESCYTLPLSFLLTEIIFFGTKTRPSGERIRVILFSFLALAFVVILAFSLFSFRIFNEISPTQGNDFSITSQTYFLTQFRVLVTYLRLFIFPAGQHLDWYYPLSHSLLELLTAGSLLILLLLITTAALLRKKQPLTAFGIIFFFLASAVESGIIPIPNVIFEHRAYLPGAGLVLSASSLVFHLLAKYNRRLPLMLLISASVLLGIAAHQRNKVWATEFSLWIDCVEKSPLKPRCNNNFGFALYNLGKNDEALKYFDIAVKLNPTYELAYNNRGNARLRKGDLAGAISDYSEAIRLKPDYHEAYYNRGNAHVARRDFLSAEKDFSNALELNNGYWKAYINRGNVRSILKKNDEALSDFNTGLSYRPDDAAGLYGRGYAHYDLGRLNEACRDWEKAANLGSREAVAALQKHCSQP